MLVRIVRMEFAPEKVSDFLKIFEAAHPKISSQPGCVEVKLMRDAQSSQVYYTHSLWQSEKYLEMYRQSELFETTWAKTKVLFQAKPLAFSLIEPVK